MLLKSIFVKKPFDFPKSLYAVADAIRFFVANKPNALIVDFFAGSGTTLHAVNLLNAEDGGNRRCIMVTNNEVSEEEAKQLRAKGFRQGDEAWERLGIARYVTWPRTVCSVRGRDVNGNALKGDYLGSDRPMSEGFRANVEYFKLGFLDKNAVAIGSQFREILPLLWMKSGARGERPALDGDDIPTMLVLPANHFAVLTDARRLSDFSEAVRGKDIDMAFIVTDSRSVFERAQEELAVHVPTVVQLYRDYLDNFRINEKK